MKKKIFLILSSLLVVALLISFKIWFQPFFHKQTLLSLKQIPHITLEWKKFQTQSWKLKAEIHQVLFQHEQMDQTFQSEKVTFQIAPWASLKKRKIMINIHISDLNQEIQIKNNNSTPWTKLFQIIQNLPLHKLEIQHLVLKVQTLRGTISSPHTWLNVINYSDNIHLKLNSNLKFQQSDLDLDTHLIIQKDKIKFLTLQFFDNQSQILASGEWKNWPLLKNISFNIHASKWNIAQTLPWISLWKSIPYSLTGHLDLQAQVNYDHNKKWHGEFDIEATDPSFEHILLSKLKAQGQLNQKSILGSLIHLEKKDGWTSFIENAQLNWNQNQTFQLTHFSNIKNFKDIEDIFGWETSFQFTAPLNGECKGELRDFKIQCSMNAKFNDFSILQEKEKIIQLHNFKTKGDWSWDSNKKFSTQGVLTAYQSKIRFQGKTIKNDLWKASFDGKWNASNFQHFFNQDVQTKVYLKKGILRWNDAKKSLSIRSHVSSNQFQWNRIDFGDVTYQAHFTPERIHFKKLKGKKGQSIYSGEVSFLFDKPWIKAQIKSNRMFLKDISESLKNLTPLPLFGRGYLTLSIDSPLIVDKLDYQLNSQFNNVKVQEDFFKNLTLNIQSQKGKATITKGLLVKNKGQVSLLGVFNTSLKKLNLKVQGEGLLLEKSQIIQKITPLTGVLNFQSNIRGTFEQPKGDVHIQLNSLSHRLIPLGKSKAHFNFKSKNFRGTASLFNKKLKAKSIEFNILDRKTPVSLNLKFNNWNFIALWPVISNQVSSQVTGRASLTFPWHQPKSLTGSLSLKKLHIQYGNYPLKTLSPLHIDFNKGKFSFKSSKFEWLSQNSKIIFKKINTFQTQIKGLMRLEFLNIFLPFIKSVSGDIDFDIQIDNNLKKWNPIGSFKASNSTLHISSYIDILQSLDMRGIIKDQQLNIEKMTAQTPQDGEIEGSGMVGFFDKDHFPIDLNFKMKRSFGIYINEFIQGFGHGGLRIHGDKKPYFISGDFFVQSGHFKQELKSNDDKVPTQVTQAETKETFHWNLNLTFKEPFPLENTLFTSFIDGSIRLKGPFKNPHTVGEIRFIPDGTLHLLEHDFQLESGWLRYKSQPLLEPHFQLIGNTHFEEVKIDDNQNEVATLYKITANVTGKAGNFELKLNSQPSLPKEEILSMMALGARSIGFTNPSEQVSQIASYSGYRIGSMLFQDTIGKELNKLLGVQIYITPYINSQKNAPSSKIELHKRWFKKLNTSYTQSMDEDYNSFKLEYSLAPDFSILGIWENDKEEGSNEDSQLGIELEYTLDF